MDVVKDSFYGCAKTMAGLEAGRTWKGRFAGASFSTEAGDSFLKKESIETKANILKLVGLDLLVLPLSPYLWPVPGGVMQL